MKNEETIELYIKLLFQIKDLKGEFFELSKKKPDDPVNKFKLNFVNNLLSKSNSILPIKYLPFEEFECFSEDDVPTNSDVLLMLTQYISCLIKFGKDNVVYNSMDFKYYWDVENSMSDINADISIFEA